MSVAHKGVQDKSLDMVRDTFRWVVGKYDGRKVLDVGFGVNNRLKRSEHQVHPRVASSHCPHSYIESMRKMPS